MVAAKVVVMVAIIVVVMVVVGRHGCCNCDQHDGACHDGSDFTLSLVQLAVVVWWSLKILLTHPSTNQPTNSPDKGPFTNDVIT